MMELLIFLFQQTMFFSIPLLIVAIGGLFSERSGVVNIALEGTMIIGALFSILFLNKTQDFMSGQWQLILAMLIAAITGAAFALLHAYASITLRADQTISGASLNMIAPAAAIYLARTIQENGVQQIMFHNTFRIERVPLLSDIPILGPMLFRGAYITTYIGIAILFAAAFVLYKTKFGLRLRACGEHPKAVDSVGIDVYKMRYLAVILSGALAGLGGLVFIVPTSVNFNASVGGYGFLALAVLIFGQWKPLRILTAALFFGLMKTISASYSVIPFLQGFNIPSDIYKMIPYVATLIVLAFSSKQSHAPKALGIPFKKSS